MLVKRKNIKVYDFEDLQVYEIREKDNGIYTYNYYVKRDRCVLDHYFGVEKRFTDIEIKNLYYNGYFENDNLD